MREKSEPETCGGFSLALGSPDHWVTGNSLKCLMMSNPKTASRFDNKIQ